MQKQMQFSYQGVFQDIKEVTSKLFPQVQQRKVYIWLLYEETTRQHLRLSVAYFTLCQVWRRFLQHVIVARPMTDLCAVCQKHSAAIIRSVNLSEEEKSEVHYT